MNYKMKIMQGICLSLLVMLIGFIVFYYMKLTSPNDSNTNGGMNETGFGVLLLLLIGGFVSLYTLIYAYFYIRSWRGKQGYHFHRMNANFTGLISLFVLLPIIIFRKVVLILYLGPLFLPLLFLSFTSFYYVKNNTK